MKDENIKQKRAERRSKLESIRKRLDMRKKTIAERRSKANVANEVKP